MAESRRHNRHRKSRGSWCHWASERDSCASFVQPLVALSSEVESLRHPRQVIRQRVCRREAPGHLPPLWRPVKLTAACARLRLKVSISAMQLRFLVGLKDLAKPAFLPWFMNVLFAATVMLTVRATHLTSLCCPSSSA